MPIPLSSGRNIPDTPEVRAALDDPWLLVKAATGNGPGWSEPYGGPEGVALLATEIRERLDVQARAIAELRSVAVAELLRDQSLSAVGKVLGIGKTAVHKIVNEVSKRPHNYRHLLAEGKW